jgi:hypothetical protein
LELLWRIIAGKPGSLLTLSVDQPETLRVSGIAGAE